MGTPDDVQTTADLSSENNITKETLLQAFRLNRMKQMKLERLIRYNAKLKEELNQERIKTSNCALMVIDYMEKTEDKLLPSIWGWSEDNRFSNSNNGVGSNSVKLERGHSNNYAYSKKVSVSDSNSCCTLM